MTEPRITINGTELTEAQAMAVRVATSCFFNDMSEPNALGEDEHGRAMSEAYRQRLVEVFRLMQKP